jgi:xanthine dehydrogenase accessory factor
VSFSPLPEWPLFGYADDVRPALAAAMARGEPAALVTLYKVEGGGPRPPGTQMLFAGDQASGFLSGGCVESDIAGHAQATLRDGEARGLISAYCAAPASSSWWNGLPRMTPRLSG